MVVFLTVIYLFIYFINRDKPRITYDPIQKNRQETYKVINDPKLNSTREGKVIIAGYRLITCGLVGEGCTNNPTDGNKNYQRSVFGFMGNLITLPYANPSASGVYWVYSGLQRAGFIPKTYAAEGLGFASLKPILKLWSVFRDVAYMLLVLVLIAIGFMIMFRMKLNPQTVISIENSLPRIIISLILITFSFAIAGFLIDLMNVLIVLGIAIVSQADKNMNPLQLQNKYLVASFKEVWNGLFLNRGFTGFTALIDLGNSIMRILPSFINDIVRLITGVIIGMPLIQMLGNIVKNTNFTGVFNNITLLGVGIGEIPSFALGGTTGMILIFVVLSLLALFGLGWVLGLLIFFTLVFLLFRIFALLFKAYLQIFILIILSPIILLFEAIPGKNAFSYWFKSLLSEILTFPIVILLLLIGQVITTIALSGPTDATLWTPPFLFGLNSQAFSFLLGVGIIMMIPEFLKAIKQFMGIKEGLPIQLGLGTFFGGVSTGVGGITGLLGQFSSIGLGIGAIFGTQDGGLLGMLGIKKKPKATT